MSTLGPSQFLDDGVGVLFRCRLTAQVPCNGCALGNCLKGYDILMLDPEQMYARTDKAALSIFSA